MASSASGDAAAKEIKAQIKTSSRPY